MCQGLGVSAGLVSLSAFIACFGALHMLNRIVHISVDASVHVDAKLVGPQSSRCQKAVIVDNVNIPHLTWLELFYMKWTVVLTMFYSFAVMILIRAKYLSNLNINLMASNAMMLVGSMLSVVLIIATCILQERTPFPEMRCNEYIVYYMYFIALNTAVAVLFFIIQSCQFYCKMTQPEYAI